MSGDPGFASVRPQEVSYGSASKCPSLLDSKMATRNLRLSLDSERKGSNKRLGVLRNDNLINDKSSFERDWYTIARELPTTWKFRRRLHED